MGQRRSVRRLFVSLLGLGALIWAACAGDTSAQMVTGRDMENFGPAFGVNAKDRAVQQLACSLGANVLWPGEEAAFTFHVKTGRPLKGPITVDVIQYGTKGKPGDWWRPIVFKIAGTSTMTLDVDLPAEGGLVTVRPKIGATFGGYALVFDLGEKRRVFGCTCVRVPAPEPGRVYEPSYALDLPWPHEMSPQVYNVFQRLGVKEARVEGGYNTIKDAHIDWAMANDLTLMLTVGAGNTPPRSNRSAAGGPG